MQAASSKMQNEIAPLPSHTTQILVESGDSTAVGSQIGHPTNGSVIAIVLVCLTIFIGSVASIVVVYLRRKKTKANHQTAVTSDDTHMSDLNNKTSHTRDIEHNTSHQYEQTKLDSFTTGSDKQTSESDKWSLNVQTEYSTASKPQAKDYHLSPLQNDYGHVKTENNFPRSSLQNGYVSQWQNKCQTPMSKIDYQTARKQHYSLLSSLQTGCQMPSLQNKWQPSMSQNEFTASPWQKEGQLSDYKVALPQQQNQPSSLQNESEAKPWQKECQLSDYPVARPHQQTPPSLSPKFNEYRTPSWQHGCKKSNDTPVFPRQQICQRSNHGETSLPPFFQEFTKMINSSSNNRHIHLQSVGQNDDYIHAQVFDNEFAETADNKEFYQTDKTYLAKEKLIYTGKHGSM